MFARNPQTFPHNPTGPALAGSLLRRREREHTSTPRDPNSVAAKQFSVTRAKMIYKLLCVCLPALTLRRADGGRLVTFGEATWSGQRDIKGRGLWGVECVNISAV